MPIAVSGRCRTTPGGAISVNLLVANTSRDAEFPGVVRIDYRTADNPSRMEGPAAIHKPRLNKPRFRSLLTLPVQRL
jgi:hypothetical protein